MRCVACCASAGPGRRRLTRRTLARRRRDERGAAGCQCALCPSSAIISLTFASPPDDASATAGTIVAYTLRGMLLLRRAREVTTAQQLLGKISRLVTAEATLRAKKQRPRLRVKRCRCLWRRERSVLGRATASHLSKHPPAHIFSQCGVLNLRLVRARHVHEPRGVGSRLNTSLALVTSLRLVSPDKPSTRPSVKETFPAGLRRLWASRRAPERPVERSARDEFCVHRGAPVEKKYSSCCSQNILSGVGRTRAKESTTGRTGVPSSRRQTTTRISDEKRTQSRARVRLPPAPRVRHDARLRGTGRQLVTKRARTPHRAAPRRASHLNTRRTTSAARRVEQPPATHSNVRGRASTAGLPRVDSR